MKANQKRYFVELGAAILIYALVLIISLSYLRANPDSGLKVPVALVPMIPALFLPIVIVRYLRTLDEMQRKIQLEGLGFAFGGTAILTFGYGFLENVGFPHLSFFWVWMVMAMLWIVGALIARWRFR